MSETVVMQPSVFQGTVYSSALAWEPGATMVIARGLLSDEDLADEALSMEICIEPSYDGGNVFESAGAKSQWQGGLISPVTEQPAPPEVQTSFSQSQQTPTHIRVRLDSPTPVSAGAKFILS